MSLTLEAEQRLQDAGLVQLYVQHAQTWQAAAQQTKDFVTANFPANVFIRRDDVAKALYPILEVNELLKTYLDGNKLRGKFWIRFFVDLIIDKTWDNLT